MKRVMLIAGTAFILAATSDAAWAQIPQYSSGPTTGSGGPSLQRSKAPVVSRYTGLLGSQVGAGGGVGYQYFTRVQPQQNAANQIGNLRNAVNKLESGPSGGTSSSSPFGTQFQAAPTDQIGPTGHYVGYLSHRTYFGTSAAPAGFGQTSGGAGGGPGLGNYGPSGGAYGGSGFSTVGSASRR
jgi:hypothetical protein